MSDESESNSVVNRSGSVGIQAATVNIYGDVTGRDKNISAGTYIGHVEVHYHGSAAVDKAPIPLPRTQVAKLFISYKRNADPDQQLAITLYEVLTRGGHQVFMDTTMRTGDAWLEEIDRQLKASDFLIVLLSRQSADSEMVGAEVRRAYKYRKLQGRPQTLPVRVAYQGLLPYSIDAFLDPLQYVVWQSDVDTARICEEPGSGLDELRLLRSAESHPYYLLNTPPFPIWIVTHVHTPAKSRA